MIAPNDPALTYSPGNWSVNATMARTINPGAYLRFAATASAITLNFDLTGMGSDAPILKYRIDQAGWVTIVISASLTLTIPQNAWRTHTVDLVVAATSEGVNRWDPMQAHVTLTGIDLGSGALSPTVKRPVTGMVLGDSITEGYKALADSTQASGSDNTVAWSGRLGDALGAEVGVVGFGGQAWAHGGMGGVPAFTVTYDQILNGTPRDFAGLDFVVVNMGENDGDGADPALIATWISTMLSKLPTGCVLFMMRPFSGKAATAITQALAEAASNRVVYIDTTGWFDPADSSDGQHPYGYASATIAPRLATVMRTTLSGGAPTVFRRTADGSTTPVRTATSKGA